MGASDTLLQLIAHLQRDVEVAHGRRTLLEYARRSSGARLALLFLLDEERQELKLLEYCGRQPRHSSSRNSGEIFDPNHIPVDGVFSSALGTAGLVHISNIHTDLRSLREEQYKMLEISRKKEHRYKRGKLWIRRKLRGLGVSS